MAEQKNNKQKKLKMADIVAKSALLEIAKKKAEPLNQREKKIEPVKAHHKEKDIAPTSEAPFLIKDSEPDFALPLVPHHHKPEVRIPPHVKLPENLGHRVKQFEKNEIERFEREEKIRKRKKFPVKTYALAAIFLIFLGGGVYSALAFLPRAKIIILTKKIDWKFSDAVLATAGAVSVNPAAKIIPAEVFSQEKNFTFSFPASGKKNIQKKSSGVITIYNGYSSKAQLLVANTRFAAPDGKIFRVTEKVVIPGAKATGGELTPSSINVPVVADKPGPEYNIGPTSRFIIPGLIGTPKYDKFYGESKSAMTGGLVGSVAFATDDDVKKYEPQAKKSLEDNIDSLLRFGISEDFKVIDGSERFTVLKEAVNKIGDLSGNFSIFLDARASIVAFREADVLSLMKSLANSDFGSKGIANSGSFDIKDYKMSYGRGDTDMSASQISFSSQFSGIFWQPVNVPDFEQKSLAKSEADLKTLVDSLASIDKVTISFWPFWVKSVPGNPNRVEVEVK